MAFSLRNDNIKWNQFLANPIYMAIIITLVITFIVYFVLISAINDYEEDDFNQWKIIFKTGVYSFIAIFLGLYIHYQVLDQEYLGKYEDKMKSKLMEGAGEVDINLDTLTKKPKHYLDSSSVLPMVDLKTL